MVMTDGDDLPDHDYESIYGHEAYWARLLARLERIERKLDVQLAKDRAEDARQAIKEPPRSD